jgi:hypothetical protein
VRRREMEEDAIWRADMIGGIDIKDNFIEF